MSCKIVIVGFIICNLLWITNGIACQNSCGVCHVDCSDNVMRACKRTHDTILDHTMELTMKAYRSSNKSLTQFRHLLNASYTAFFMDKYNNCTHPSYEQEEDKATSFHHHNIYTFYILIIILAQISI